MAANVYSKFLAAGVVAGGFHSIYTVPAGYTAVLRSLAVTGGGPYYTNCLGPQLYDNLHGYLFWRIPELEVVQQSFYSWDTHQVLETGDGLSWSLASAEAGLWQYRLSGYQLTLP